MNKIHTHYDNLKIARNAPEEIIRAAYRALSQKHHPDRDSSNPESTKIMALINTSYEVLSDPDKRRAHDLWIREMERKSHEQVDVDAQQYKPSTFTVHTKPKPHSPFLKFLTGLYQAAFTLLKLMATYAIRLGVVFGALWLIVYGIDLVKGGTGEQKLNTKPHHTTPIQPKYVRPNLSPNGQLWPRTADYIQGYEQLNKGGLSSVTIDNGKNSSDVYVKLVSLTAQEPIPVRQFYIPAYGKFKVSNIAAGHYDIRYRDLGDGGLSRSEAFNLEEIATANGKQYSDFTMTLFKVRNGNMQTYGISESDF